MDKKTEYLKNEPKNSLSRKKKLPEIVNNTKIGPNKDKNS
jgi:hypothetical protein